MARQHVHFVDNVDLEAGADRQVAHPVQDLADVVDAGPACGVHLHHVEMPVLGDRPAMLAGATGIDRQAAGAIGADAVEALGDQAGSRGLADPADAGQDESVGDTVGGEGVGEGADQRLLSDQLGEGLRAILAGEDPIVAGRRDRVQTAQKARLIEAGVPALLLV